MWALALYSPLPFSTSCYCSKVVWSGRNHFHRDLTSHSAPFALHLSFRALNAWNDLAVAPSHRQTYHQFRSNRAFFLGLHLHHWTSLVGPYSSHNTLGWSHCHFPRSNHLHSHSSNLPLLILFACLSSLYFVDLRLARPSHCQWVHQHQGVWRLFACRSSGKCPVQLIGGSALSRQNHVHSRHSY